MNNIKNTRGFTLVELLAVIVVLAIVMVIAVNAIMPQMAEARKNIFAIEANGAIESAQTYFTNNSLKGQKPVLPAKEGKVCVDVEDLYDAGVSELNPNNFKGKVIAEKVKDSNNYQYTVYLQKTSDNLKVVGKGIGSDIEGDDVDDGTLSETEETCQSTDSST